MSLTIENGEFYLATIRDEQTLHAHRDEAIDQLRSAPTIDPDEDAVSIDKVTVGDGDWTITPLQWSRIALELLRGESQ